MADISAKVERNVALLDENKSVLEAAQMMVDRYIGSVVVTRDNRINGIFTERDLMRIVAQRRDASAIRVKEVMTTDLVRAHPDDTVEQCLASMRANRCRHLVVFEGESFVGIVSLRDLAMVMLDEKEVLIAQLTRYITG
jgi:CBS domain-containing protein